MKGKQDLTPKNDFIFKEIFSEEEILKDFLESLLQEKIHTIKIEEDIQIRTNIKDKIGVLDIRAEINNSKIVSIEMQKKNKYNMEQRTLYYGGKITAKMLKKGEDYRKLKPIIMINILNYPMLDLPQYYTKTVTVAENYREYEVVKGIQYGFIELAKFRKKKPDINNKLDQWLIFIENNNKELIKMIEERNPIIKKAESKRKYLTGKAAEERLQELREKAEFDENTAYAAGKEIGEKRGQKNKAIKIAREMLKDNISIEKIVKYTGLDNVVIQKLMKRV